MSKGERFPLERGEALAVLALRALAPLVTQIAVAGSVRRKRPDIGDVDVVAVLDTDANPWAHAQVEAAVAGMGLVLTKSGEQIVSARDPQGGPGLDIYITPLDRWWIVVGMSWKHVAD